MQTRRIARAAGALVIVFVAFAGGAALVFAAVRGHVTRQSSAPPRTASIACSSPSLGGQLPALVYLPAGYSTRGRRYRVIYFLHGLPATPQSYTQNAFVVQSLEALHWPAIVVAPQGARNDGDDREYLDWSSSENWPRAITHDLTRCIDRRYHTLANRRGRALIGLSAGGYGAANIGLRNLQTFGAVESWSGYFVATDPSGWHVLQLPSPQAQRAATVPDGADLSAELRRWPGLIAFYVGRQDDRFLAMNQAFDAALNRGRIPHVFATYPGGHTVALWASEGPSWLEMALRYLATGHVPHGAPAR